MKKCSKCKRELSEKSFHKGKNQCISCLKKYQYYGKAYYKKKYHREASVVRCSSYGNCMREKKAGPVTHLSAEEYLELKKKEGN